MDSFLIVSQTHFLGFLMTAPRPLIQETLFDSQFHLEQEIFFSFLFSLASHRGLKLRAIFVPMFYESATINLSMSLKRTSISSWNIPTSLMLLFDVLKFYTRKANVAIFYFRTISLEIFNPSSLLPLASKFSPI